MKRKCQNILHIIWMIIVINSIKPIISISICTKYSSRTQVVQIDAELILQRNFKTTYAWMTNQGSNKRTWSFWCMQDLHRMMIKIITHRVRKLKNALSWKGACKYIHLAANYTWDTKALFLHYHSSSQNIFTTIHFHVIIQSARMIIILINLQVWCSCPNIQSRKWY